MIPSERAILAEMKATGFERMQAIRRIQQRAILQRNDRLRRSALVGGI